MISRLLLLAFPAAEIYLFVYISNLTSGWITIVLILSSTILGLGIIRIQGRQIANRLRQNLINKQLKLENMANQMIFAFAGFLLIIPRTRPLASAGITSMLVVLYWANFNMWYNDIPLNGTQFDDFWHFIRMLIQIGLILTIAWIGQITPFKVKAKHIKSTSSEE